MFKKRLFILTSEQHFLNKEKTNIDMHSLNKRKENHRKISAVLLQRQAACVHAVYWYFMNNADEQTGISYASLDKISEETGYKQRQVMKATKILDDLNIIYKMQRGSQTNIYLINYHLSTPLESTE